jgi:hypothetical protein
MKRLLAVLLPAVAALLLVTAGRASADACFGGPHRRPMPADGGPTTDGGTSFNLGKGPRKLGAGFLFVASVTSGWLCFRRKGPGDKE